MPISLVEYNARYYAANREKILARKAAHRTANRKEILERQVKHYAVNREKVLSQVWKQRGLPTPTRPMPLVCENCDGPPNGHGSLHLDHCHKTGVFRGWLCSNCNTGIGKLGDSTAGLQRAIAYLERAAQPVWSIPAYRSHATICSDRSN